MRLAVSLASVAIFNEDQSAMSKDVACNVLVAPAKVYLPVIVK